MGFLNNSPPIQIVPIRVYKSTTNHSISRSIVMVDISLEYPDIFSHHILIPNQLISNIDWCIATSNYTDGHMSIPLFAKSPAHFLYHLLIFIIYLININILISYIISNIIYYHLWTSISLFCPFLLQIFSLLSLLSTSPQLVASKYWTSHMYLHFHLCRSKPMLMLNLLLCKPIVVLVSFSDMEDTIQYRNQPKHYYLYKEASLFHWNFHHSPPKFLPNYFYQPYHHQHYHHQHYHQSYYYPYHHSYYLLFRLLHWRFDRFSKQDVHYLDYYYYFWYW